METTPGKFNDVGTGLSPVWRDDSGGAVAM